VDSHAGRKLRTDSGDMFVPPGYKRISLAGSSGDFAPGTLLETELYVSPAFRSEASGKLASAAVDVTIYHDGCEVELDRRRLSPKQALFSLVRDYHLLEQDAREMLKEAQQHRKQTFQLQPPANGLLKMGTQPSWLENAPGMSPSPAPAAVPTMQKRGTSAYGQDPYLAGQGPQAPAVPEPPMGYDQVMGSGVPLQGEQQIKLPVPELSAWLTDPTIYNPNTMLDVTPMDRIQQRPQYNDDQKTTFDGSSVARLMHTVRDDTLVDQHIKKLMDGLDATGRVLFGFYQHPDKFAERYGKAEMPEMEDSLRNLLETAGRVTLFLKQKTVEPHQDAALADQDLEPVAE
jgi:hypothetical protein